MQQRDARNTPQGYPFVLLSTPRTASTLRVFLYSVYCGYIINRTGLLVNTWLIKIQPDQIVMWYLLILRRQRHIVAESGFQIDVISDR